MTKKKTAEYINFIRTVDAVADAVADATGKRPNLFDLATVVAEWSRQARSLHRRYESQCSYEWASSDAYYRKTERAGDRLIELVKSHGLHAYLQTDPRGGTLYVSAQPIENTNYNRAIFIA